MFYYILHLEHQVFWLRTQKREKYRVTWNKIETPSNNWSEEDSTAKKVELRGPEKEETNQRYGKWDGAMVQNKLEITHHQKKPDGIRGKKEEARGVYTIGGTNMKCGWQREAIQKGLNKINFWSVIYPYDASNKYFRNKRAIAAVAFFRFLHPSELCMTDRKH